MTLWVVLIAKLMAIGSIVNVIIFIHSMTFMYVQSPRSASV